MRRKMRHFDEHDKLPAASALADPVLGLFPQVGIAKKS